MKFNEADKLQLLQLASDSIHFYVKNNKRLTPVPGLNYPPLNVIAGAFVSVYYNKKLRGCLGRFKSKLPLYLLIARLAASAASKDYRFSPILKEELDKLSVEISVLTPLHKIKHADEIIIGKHGIYIRAGNKAGTLLPQVAVKQGWNNIELLEYCAEYKTGIEKNAWKNAELFTYEAIIFGNKAQAFV